MPRPSRNPFRILERVHVYLLLQWADAQAKQEYGRMGDIGDAMLLIDGAEMAVASDKGILPPERTCI